MCSTVSEQLARIGQAIDELAAESRGTGRPSRGAGAAGTGAAGTGTAGAESAGTEPAGTASLDDRLARIWLMMAELDPQLASRITSYGGSAQ
jgi:hypothetical protein